ncbi:MAG: metallophosphoesterase [Candidatus Methanoperedens sp.]|nr:metallophosphoesterase [Candidatus Methanoperedens sp.]
MVKKVDIRNTTIMWIMLMVFIVTPAVADSTPPASVSNLHMINRGTNYINWGWADPTTSDFNHVDVYINGVYKGGVLKGIKHYNTTSLIPNNPYTIITQTVDNSGNINQTWKTNTQTTKVDASSHVASGMIRFMTVGDPHLTSDTSTDPYKRFTRAVNYINGRSDVDFMVVMGDIVDSASSTNFGVAKALLSKLNKPYYIVPGNHDLGSSISKFEGYFGSAERVVNINGYQLIFVSIKKDASGNNHWSFDYSRADKSKPTVIFNHGPVQPKGTVSCTSGWGAYYGYACDMKKDVDSFAKLLGYYNGHVHIGTNQLIRGERYVTEDNLGGNGADSNYIGYTKIVNGVLTYSKVLY